MLTPAQLQTLKTAILAETDPSVVQWRAPATRDDRSLADWYNAASTTAAWGTAVAVESVDDAVDYSTYDTLSAGKRDSWALFIARPRDFARNKTRKWTEDVFGASSANAVAVLQAAIVKARRIEVVFGGNTKTSSGLSALDRSYVGTVGLEDISKALNA